MGLWSSRKHYLNQVGFDEHQQEERPKRITSSAGHRLSVILENGSTDSQLAKARQAHRASAKKGTLSAGLPTVVAEVPEDGSAHSSGYSSNNVWADNEKFAALRNHKQIAKRGGWKRLVLILVAVLLLIIALGVGLGLGLKRKKLDGATKLTTATSSPASPVNSPFSTASIDPAVTDLPHSPSSTSPASSSSPSQPANFPLGTYSFVTFLDTVQTNCTANPQTWTCYPYTDYYTSNSKSLATFNWAITGRKGAYKISSTDNPFSITFKNANLELLDEGKDRERYRFQITQTKTVAPSTNLTADNAAVSCDFVGGNLQATLFTRMKKEYPSDQDPDDNPSYTAWPYAVRVEQVAAGGQGTPKCYKTTTSGQRGDAVTDGLAAQDASTLCSCLYKNWHTAT